MQKENRPSAGEPVNLDADLMDADWTKQGWDIPASNVDELLVYLKQQGWTVAQFKTWPVFQLNVTKLPWLNDLPDDDDEQQEQLDVGDRWLPRRLDGGRLLVPRRAETTLPDGTTVVGDGWVEIGPDDEEFAEWLSVLDREGGEQR